MAEPAAETPVEKSGTEPAPLESARQVLQADSVPPEPATLPATPTPKELEMPAGTDVVGDDTVQPSVGELVAAKPATAEDSAAASAEAMAVDSSASKVAEVAAAGDSDSAAPAVPETAESLKDAPMADTPVAAELAANKPLTQELTSERPATTTLETDEPMAEESKVEGLAASEVVTDESMPQEPKIHRPAAVALDTDEPMAEEPAIAPPGSVELVNDEKMAPEASTGKAQAEASAEELDTNERAAEGEVSEAAKRRAGLNNKPAWMSRGIGVNKEFFGEVKGDLMKPGLTKADLERLEKSVPTGPDPFGDVFRENVNNLEPKDTKESTKAGESELDQPMAEEAAAVEIDDSEDDGPDYDPFAEEPASAQPEDQGENRDNSEAKNRRAGLDNKPAWMSRGLGVNKEIFGEVRGDLMKPGLTKADLERLEKSRPTGPDPFGDVFRENVKLPASTEPAEALSKASAKAAFPDADLPPGPPSAPPLGPLTLPPGPPPGPSPAPPSQSKSAPQSKSTQQQSKAAGRKKDVAQSKTGQTGKSGPKAALESLPVKMPPATPKHSVLEAVPAKSKGAVAAATPKMLPVPAEQPVPALGMPMEIEMPLVMDATFPGVLDMGAALAGTLPAFSPDSLTMPGALPVPMAGLLPTAQDMVNLQQQVGLGPPIGGLLPIDPMMSALAAPLPTGLPSTQLLSDLPLLPDTLPLMPDLMIGQIGLPPLPLDLPMGIAPMPLDLPPLPLDLPPLPLGAMPDLSGILPGLPAAGFGVVPDLMAGAPSLELMTWEVNLSPEGMPYYHCKATGESRWERPSGPADVVIGGESLAQGTGQPPAGARKGPATVKEQIGEPESTETIGRTGWLRVETEKGYKYFFNKKKKITSWTCPKEIEKEVAELDGALGVTPAEEKKEKKAADEGQEKKEASAEETADGGSAEAVEGGSAPSRPSKAERVEAQERQKEEEQRASKEKQRLLNFKQLLIEKGVKQFDKYEKWLPKLIHDSRFTAIPGQKERKALFDAIAKKIDAERRKQAADKKRGGREAFRELMKKAGELDMFNERSLHKVQQAMQKKFGTDPGWTAIAPRERERAITEAHEEVEKKRTQGREAANRDFRALILVALRGKEERPPRWRDIKQRIEKEDKKRWDAVESLADREKLYEQVVKDLEAARKKKQRRQRQDEAEVETARKKRRLEEAEEKLHNVFAERIKNPFEMDWDDAQEALGSRSLQKCGLREEEQEKIWDEYKQGAIETRRGVLVQHLKDTPADVITPDMSPEEVFKKALDSTARKAFSGLEADVVQSAYDEWRSQAYEAAVSVCRKWLKSCEHFRGTEDIDPTGGPEFEMFLKRLSTADVRFRRLNGRPGEQKRLVRARLEELRQLRTKGRSDMDADDE